MRCCKAANARIDQGLEFETQGFALAFSTEDMREGTRAFLEKRKAAVQGQLMQARRSAPCARCFSRSFGIRKRIARRARSYNACAQ